jgi:hypothetical protein
MHFPATSALAMLACALSGLTGSAAAQETPPGAGRWSNLEGLGGSRRVRVETRSGERRDGVLEQVDANRLTLREPNGNAVPIERDAIRRVTRKSRKRGALYGLLVGFAGGFAAGAAYGPYLTDFGYPGAGTRIKFGVGFGMCLGGIGAGIGALAGTRITVYP